MMFTPAIGSAVADFAVIELDILAVSNGLVNGFKVIGTPANEPPRLYRRVIYLSQAAMPDRVKLS